ncbi:uncharacterized protein Tco025E_00264 [Trypanosoma conorhini]|uniref:J domain-containing protein n=1 Tax=Trypanosoma conorhini TaxID=83891 RepID=A0A3R7SBB3_9TRYP|nr:uncharacterized protein Tco025E_00264 [Trypanosoma conorhini]RNF27527.1 hypothetical protein Tco025E_00264 [Trypanosoma conorhini]
MVIAGELSGEALVSYVLRTDGDAVRLFGADGVMAEPALKRVYKALALRLHPDKNTLPGAHEAFQVLQQNFEGTLEALRSKAPAGRKSPPTSSSPPFNGPTAPPPPPPPPPPPLFTAFAQSSLPGDRKKEQRQRPRVVADNTLFEIPLPPDIFAECVAHDNPTPTEASATSRRAKPPAKRTAPLPALDFSSGDDDREEESGGRQAPRQGDGCGPANCELNAERKAALRKKRGKSRRTLMQLFAEFNISDEEEDKASVHHPKSKESFQRQQPVPGKPDSSGASAAVACPRCGVGVFYVHIVSGVVCPSCSAQFVPAAVSMMGAKRHATGGRKETTSRAELCACGKARKGLCFICD